MKSKHSARWMIIAMAAAMAAGLAGCEDSARQPAAYHPPPPPASAPGTSAADQRSAFQYVADEQLPLEAPAQNLPAVSATLPNGIERLREQVQAIYDQGDREVQAGRAVEARQEFDVAYRLLLESGFDLRSDSRLLALRDEVVQASAVPMNATQALAQASSQAPAPPGEQPSAPSPLDEITDLAGAPGENPATPPSPKLMSSAEVELQEIPHDLPLTVNDIVLSYLNFFQTTRGRVIVETGLRRAGRYRNMIEEVLREEGLPIDLMYMVQAESAFQPQALSRAGARGLWQFMSFRGKEYGLQHTAWVDDRQDPEKATRAAAHHLRDLYAMFGDWYLVMAAYNSGPGTVQHAVERTGYADFWELYRLNVLPQETKDYVPIILALTLIAKAPSLYGIEVAPDAPIQTDDVMPGHALSLRLVAETLDLDLDELRAINPELLRLATPADPSFVLHLPAGTGDRFFSEMSAIPADKWLSWREHRVEAGDTLASIARTYRANAQVIAEVNDLTEYSTAGAPHFRLEPGTKLIIPVSEQPQLILGKRLRYRTRQGDTLESVADEFDVTVTDLKKWNHLRSDHIVGGMRLTIYPAGSTPSAESTRSGHTPAEASRPATTVTARAAATRTPQTLTPNSAPTAQKVVHRVQRGETLYSIASAYKITVDALRAGNRFLFSRPLQVGDALIIPLQR